MRLRWLFKLFLVMGGCSQPLSLCAQASAHARSCLGESAPPAAQSCDPAAAQQVLAQDCAALVAGRSAAKTDGGFFSKEMCSLGLQRWCTWTFVATFLDADSGAPIVGAWMRHDPTLEAVEYGELGQAVTGTDGVASFDDLHSQAYDIGLTRDPNNAAAVEPCQTVQTPGNFQSVSATFFVRYDAAGIVMSCAP